MKALLIVATCAAVAAVPSFAQMQNNTEKQLSCDNSGNDGSRARHCEVREVPAGNAGRINVDGIQNGSVSVKGWFRSDVLVRAKVDTQASSQSEADSLARSVSIGVNGGEVRATGPESANRSNWSVSFEIFAPQNTDVTLKTSNGSIHIADVRGQIHFESSNGSVHLARLAGDVTGATVNGSVHVELAGSYYDGRQMDLTTSNGSVTISAPATYSAHVKAETGNGSIRSDYPMTVQGRIDTESHNRDFNIGSGGALIHIATSNGSIRLERASQ